uniref:Ig-like domain-containing protein n=1 Tax=Esox lucius TaxID=8010 RepID=A0AAY5K7D4_ESOLU
MVLSTTGSVLVSFLWSLTVVLGQGDWGVTYSTQSICVLKGSTVELSCTYKYPSGYNVTSTFWFTKEISTENYVNLSDDPDYRGHVTYHSDEENRHTLMITDLRETDSAEYKFRFITDQPGGKRIGQPGVTLSVTGLQVEVTGGKMKTLTCNTSCPLTGIENMTCRTVNYTQRRICVLKGSSVDISCTFAGYSEVTSSLWFSPKQSGRWRDKLIPEDLTTDPGYAGRVEIQNCSGQSILRITGLKEEDSAEYRFTFKTKYNFQWGHDFPGTTLTFPEVQVNVTPATVTEGQNVTLTCITSCPLTGNTTYIWYKKTETSPKASGQSYSITNVTSEDWREYYCEVRNGRGSMYSSTLMVTVAGKQTSVLTACVGITVVVLVLILCLSGLIWFRKSGCNSPNKADGQKDSSPMYENISDMVMTSTAEQTSDTDNQDDLHYDSIHYSSSKEQEEHLYSTIK